MDATQRVRAMLSFVRAADRGSFAAAARMLGITPAAVGKNVAGLEGALGVRLMNRSTRSLQLTSEGQAFLEGAREAIDALDSAIDSMASQCAAPVGRVRIASGYTFGHRYLMPILPRLIQRYPGLVPEVELDDRRVDIVRDGFDLALRGGPLEDSNLVSRHICDLPVILVASPDYLEQRGTPRHINDLKKHSLIAIRFLNGQTGPWNFKSLASTTSSASLPGPASLVVSDPYAAVEAAVSGIGIAQAGTHHVWQYLKSGRLKIVLSKQYASGNRSMALQYPHRALVAPRVRAVADFLLQEFAEIEELHVPMSDLELYLA